MSKDELRRRIKAVTTPNQSKGEIMKDADIMAQLAALREENARLKVAATKSEGTISFKVTQARAPGTNGKDDKGSKGGAVSAYGLGRFPVTLYKGQWLRLIAVIDKLKQFLDAHDSELSEKD